MLDPKAASDEFAEGALSAVRDIESQAKNEERAEPAKSAGTSEAAGTEDADIAKLASELKQSGVTPERAREAIEQLALVKRLNTIEGQQEYWQKTIAGEAGDRLRQEFGQAWVADILSTPGGGEKLVKLAKDLGFSPETTRTADDETLSPEQKEIRELKRLNEETRRELAVVRQGTESTHRALAERASREAKMEAFADWAKAKSPMPAPAYKALATRAFELATLYPDQFGSADGFRRAVDRAHGEFSSVASAFVPPNRPRSIRSEGGGVAGKAHDFSKDSLEDRIRNAAEDFAAHAAGESEE